MTPATFKHTGPFVLGLTRGLGLRCAVRLGIVPVLCGLWWAVAYWPFIARLWRLGNVGDVVGYLIGWWGCNLSKVKTRYLIGWTFGNGTRYFVGWVFESTWNLSKAKTGLGFHVSQSGPCNILTTKSGTWSGWYVSARKKLEKYQKVRFQMAYKGPRSAPKPRKVPTHP